MSGSVRKCTAVYASVPRAAAALSLDDLIERFMASRRDGATRSGRRPSPHTLKFYRNCLDGLRYFAARRHWPPPAELTRDHLRDFRDYLDTEACRWDGDGRRATTRRAAPATVRHYLNVAKIFFNWAADEDYIPTSPAIAALLRYRLPSPDYKDVEPYRDDEVNAMLSICERDIARGNRYLGVRNKAIIDVFIDTGLRLNELTEMRLSELDPQLQQVRVLGKGAKFRVVPLNGVEARRALKLYLTQYRPDNNRGDAVWVTEDGAPMSHHSIRIMLDRLKRRAGVTSAGGAHRFRHYFATRYLENGGDLNTLRLLLGHATLYMVLKYTQFVQVRRALHSHRDYSPLDRLTQGGRYQQGDDSWGFRPAGAPPAGRRW